MKILKIVAFLAFISLLLCKKNSGEDFFKKIKKDIILRGFNIPVENSNSLLNSNTFFSILPNIFEKINEFHNEINQLQSQDAIIHEEKIPDFLDSHYYRQNIDEIQSNNSEHENLNENNSSLNNQKLFNSYYWNRNDREIESDREDEINDRHDRHDRDRHDRDRRDRDRHDRHHRHSKFLFVNIFHNKPMNIVFFIATTLALICLITFLSIKIVKKCRKITRVIPSDEENISNVNRSLENPNNITNIHVNDDIVVKKEDKETITNTPYLEYQNEYVDINRYSIKESLNNDF